MIKTEYFKRDRKTCNAYRVVMNLHYFDDVTNATTSSSVGNDLSPEMKTYYSDYLIDLAEPNLVHDQFGQKKPIPRGSGKTIEFRKYTKLPKALTPLTEGVTPEGQALDVSVVTATVAQYGGFVRITDLLDMSAIDNNIVEALRLIGQQASRTLDTVVREVLQGGTNVRRVNGRASRAAVKSTDVLTVLEIRKAVRDLRLQDAPKFDDGNYVGIIHPDAAFDLMSDPTWVDWQKYTSPEHMYENEIGKVAGVRFVESTEAKIFEEAGESDANVYGTLILGANAYGTTEITGGGLRTIIKQLGSGGTEDPLEQRATVGWKATKVAERLVEQYMIRLESGCSFG